MNDEKTMMSLTNNDSRIVETSLEPISNAIENDDELISVKASDLNRMKELIMSLRKDKQVFEDVTRRFVCVANSYFSRTDDFRTIIGWLKSCFKEKNGQLKISYLKLGKKIVSGDIPVSNIESLAKSASIKKAFEGFSYEESLEVFERNGIPLIDISPVLDEFQSLFNNQK